MHRLSIITWIVDKNESDEKLKNKFVLFHLHSLNILIHLSQSWCNLLRLNPLIIYMDDAQFN